MQEKKEGSTPVRIYSGVHERLEQAAIEESAARGKLLTIAQLANELLEKALNDRDAKPDS